MRHVTVVACLLAVAVVGGTIPGLAAESPNEPPEPEAGLDQFVERGATVLLDAGGSWDPDGEVVAVEWQIRAPNGTVIEPDCATCVETAFVPSRLGTYNVTVTVTDDDGAGRSDTLFVTTEPASPPTVDLSATSVGNGTSFRVRADVRAGDHALERLVWRVDGSRVAVEPASGQQATRRRTFDFGPNETHDVSVTAADWLGNKGRDSITLASDGGPRTLPPTVRIVRAPTELSVGETGAFVARASDPDGGPVSLDWSPSGQSGRTARLSWPREGTYTVTVTATDDEGATATASVPVTVVSASGGGGGPGLYINITQWPRQLEAGENGTFEAEAHTLDGDPVPVTWSPKSKSGKAAVMSWSMAGTKTVTATAHYNETTTKSDAVEVEVNPQDGPVADMNINPLCAPDRSHLCGPTTGNNLDPIEFTGTPTKPGGGDIVAYTWTIDGTLVSNGETFSDTFSEGNHTVTLTVEDEFGETDATHRSFDVVSSGTAIEASLDSNLDSVCSTDPDACSWDSKANELTILEGATTSFEAAVYGISNPNLDNIEWTVPAMALGGPDTNTGKRTSITWDQSGSGTLEVRYFEENGGNRAVAAVDTVSVTVVNGSNEAPQVSIDDITQVCDPDGFRYRYGGCSKTKALNVTYTVWDPDATGQVYLDGFLAPEGTQPFENEQVSPEKATYTTKNIPVRIDGDHTFRLVANDTVSVSDASISTYVTNATGGSTSNSVSVDGSWSMEVKVKYDSWGPVKATTELKCSTPDDTSKCPGSELQVNWGDGSGSATITNDYNSGSNSWIARHQYSRGDFPTVTVSVFDESGVAVKTMQWYLDLYNSINAYPDLKFDTFVTANEPNPVSSTVAYAHYDKVSIEEAYGSATWVESTNASIQGDDWIRTVDTRTQYSWTDDDTYNSYKPHCVGDCKWVLVERNAKETRGMYLDTKWYDTRQWGVAYEYVKVGYNVVQGPKYRVFTTLGSSYTTDECPDGDWVDRCHQIQEGSGYDYQYDVYQTTTEHKYRKKAGDKDYEVQKYWTERWERYRYAG